MRFVMCLAWMFSVVVACTGDDDDAPMVPPCDDQCAHVECGNPDQPMLCTCIAADGAARLCELETD